MACLPKRCDGKCRFFRMLNFESHHLGTNDLNHLNHFSPTKQVFRNSVLPPKLWWNMNVHFILDMSDGRESSQTLRNEPYFQEEWVKYFFQNKAWKPGWRQMKCHVGVLISGDKHLRCFSSPNKTPRIHLTTLKRHDIVKMWHDRFFLSLPRMVFFSLKLTSIKQMPSENRPNLTPKRIAETCLSTLPPVLGFV